MNNIKLSIHSLHELSQKFKLRSISISKTSRINHIPWEEVKSIFDSIFSNSTTKIIVCNRITQYQTKEQRTHLIEEAHSSALEGHKGVTKTYSRIRQKFFWENMKVDIQKYIQGCLQCQLKKSIRVKTKNPMVITDTPTTAFEKISMDIVGPLPETKSGNLCILTIQDNFTKYSLAIPLPNHQGSTIADAFVKKFICIFGSPKGVLTDQGRDFLSKLLKRLAKRFRIKQFRTSKPLTQQEKLQKYDDYLINFVTQLHEMRTQARENLMPAKEKSKIYYDKRINPLEVKIGDNVFLLKGGKIKKLDSH